MTRLRRPVLLVAVVLPLALALLVLVGLPAAAQRIISLTVSDVGFTKEILEADPGEEITVRLTNAGLGSHGIRFYLDGGRTETIEPLSLGRQEDLTFVVPQAEGRYLYDDARDQSAITGTLLVGIDPPTAVPTPTRPPTDTPEPSSTPEPITPTATDAPATSTPPEPSATPSPEPVYLPWSERHAWAPSIQRAPSLA